VYKIRSEGQTSQFLLVILAEKGGRESGDDGMGAQVGRLIFCVPAKEF